MVYSPPINDKKSQIPLADTVAHLVTSDIDAGATRLQPPKIRSVHGRKLSNEKRRKAPAAKPPGPITVWETPYNRPIFETPENVQYTRLALQYLQQGRIEDAERLYKQALVVAERTFSETDSVVFRAIEDLAGFYFAHERYQQAEPLVSRLLKHRIDNLPCDDWLLIRTVDQLAEIYEKCGEPLNAQALYKLLLARQEDIVGRKSLVCAFTLSRLAESYLRQDRLQAAESLMITMLEIQEGAHGRCSIEISTTLQELATIYHKLGRIDKAAEMLERLLHVLETIHGDCGLSVASCLLRLADLLAEVGMTFEAEPLYRRAQEIYRISYGDSTAAHSVFKRKLERVGKNQISKASKDKPRNQEDCSRFPALRLNLDDMLPSKLGTGQVNRCLGHGVSAESTTVQPLMKAAPVKTTTISGSDPLLDSLFVVYADSVDVSISTSEWCLTDELVKTEHPTIAISQGINQLHGQDDAAAPPQWHQVGSESYNVNPGRGIETLKLPALQPEWPLVQRVEQKKANSDWTSLIDFESPLEPSFFSAPDPQLLSRLQPDWSLVRRPEEFDADSDWTNSIDFDTPLSGAVVAAPEPQVFAALTGDSIEVHVPRHEDRMSDQPLPWNQAGIKAPNASAQHLPFEFSSPPPLAHAPEVPLSWDQVISSATGPDVEDDWVEIPPPVSIAPSPVRPLWHETEFTSMNAVVPLETFFAAHQLSESVIDSPMWHQAEFRSANEVVRKETFEMAAPRPLEHVPDTPMWHKIDTESANTFPVNRAFESAAPRPGEPVADAPLWYQTDTESANALPADTTVELSAARPLEHAPAQPLWHQTEFTSVNANFPIETFEKSPAALDHVPNQALWHQTEFTSVNAVVPFESFQMSPALEHVPNQALWHQSELTSLEATVPSEELVASHQPSAAAPEQPLWHPTELWFDESDSAIEPNELSSPRPLPPTARPTSLSVVLANTFDFQIPRQLEPPSVLPSPWHQVGSELTDLDSNRAFETLKLSALPSSDVVPDPSLPVASPVITAISRPHKTDPSSSAQLHALAPPLQQAYAATYSRQAERTLEIAPPAVLQASFEDPTAPKGEKTAEMVPPVAPPWTSQNYITGLLGSIVEPSEEAEIDTIEFAETREGIVEALRGMSVTMLETSGNIATPVDVSPPVVQSQDPDTYFQALIDEIAGSPPEPLQKVTRGDLINTGTDMPKPASMKTTTRMPSLDLRQTPLILRPPGTNFGGERDRAEYGTGEGDFAVSDVIGQNVNQALTEGVGTVEYPVSVASATGPQRPYVSKTTQQLDRLSANNHAQAVAQRNPLASRLGAKVTNSNISPGLAAPESLASALGAKTASDQSTGDESSRTKTNVSALSKVKAAITSKMPAMDRDRQTPVQQRETVKESVLMPQVPPSAQSAPPPKKRSKAQTIQPVSAPHRARY